MRFMAMVMATKESEAGVMPKPELFEAMGRFNEEMMKAGVLLALDGLQPTSKGARIRFSGGKSSVIDGPFAETKELVAGYWLIQVKSKQEAIEWMKRCPPPMGPDQDGEIEIRQVFEMSDFADVLPSGDADRRQKLKDELPNKPAQGPTDGGSK